jgi:hypothetical protein
MSKKVQLFIAYLLFIPMVIVSILGTIIVFTDPTIHSRADIRFYGYVPIAISTLLFYWIKRIKKG